MSEATERTEYGLQSPANSMVVMTGWDEARMREMAAFYSLKLVKRQAIYTPWEDAG